MTKQMERPQLKSISAKISEEDMIYFSLGVDKKEDFILPSERNSYLSDEKAVALVRAVHNGEKFIGQDFSGLNLKGADLSGGFFRECNFSKAVFYNTKMRNCQLQNVDFSGAYMEESDFTGAKLQGASFAHAFVKNTSFSEDNLDDKAKKYISELEKLIHLIEQGKVDLRTLSKSDLVHLDIRRIDFTNIDLTDIDLSVFALDGVNLMGTYIDPKQVMSREGLEQYYIDLRNMKAKKLAELEKELLKARESQLAQYGQDMLATKSLETYQNSDKKPKTRPAKKTIELAQMPPKTPVLTPIKPDVNDEKPLKQEQITPVLDKIKAPDTKKAPDTQTPDKQPLSADDNKIVLDASLLAQELLSQKPEIKKEKTPDVSKPQLPNKKQQETQTQPVKEETRRPPMPKMIIRGERNEYTERQEERARMQEQLTAQSSQSDTSVSQTSDETKQKEAAQTQSDEKKIQVSLDQLNEILKTKESTLTGMMDSVFNDEKQEDDKEDDKQEELEEIEEFEDDEDLDDEEHLKKTVFVSTTNDDSDSDDANGGVVIHQPLISDIKRVAQRGPRLKKTRLKVKG